jgi:hypothetical protein
MGATASRNGATAPLQVRITLVRPVTSRTRRTDETSHGSRLKREPAAALMRATSG